VLCRKLTTLTDVRCCPKIRTNTWDYAKSSRRACEDCTEDQRRITTAHIQLIMLAEAEADGRAPAVQS